MSDSSRSSASRLAAAASSTRGSDGFGILALGALVDVIAFSQLLVRPMSLSAALFKIGVPVVLSVAIFATFWLTRSVSDPASLQRRVVFTSVVFVSIATGTVVTIVAAGAVVFTDVVFATVMTSAAGAAAGAPMGVYYHEAVVRKRELAAEVDRTHGLNQRLHVLHRILRHNVRNNLNVALGRVRLAIEASSDAVVTDHLETALGAMQTLLGHTEKTLTLEDVSVGEQTRRQFELTAAIETQLRDVEEQFPAADVTRDFPRSARVDAHPFVDLAVGEVVRNAVEHHPGDAPSVVVSVEREAGSVTVEIRDDGPGIDPEERRALSETVESPLRHGSGVGLWFVKRITTESDGTLTIEDNDPTGTTVRLSFDRA
jgi:signal transduction histidine kinase